MARSENNISFQEKKAEKSINPITKERVLWVAEKSTYVTVPLSVYATATGAVAPAVGLAAILIDIGGYKFLKNRREGKGKSPEAKTSSENVIFLNSYVGGKTQAPNAA